MEAWDADFGGASDLLSDFSTFGFSVDEVSVFGASDFGTSDFDASGFDASGLVTSGLGVVVWVGSDFFELSSDFLDVLILAIFFPISNFQLWEGV